MATTSQIRPLAPRRRHHRLSAAVVYATPATAALPDACEPLGQRVVVTIGGSELCFDWGFPHELGTAAYWMEQTRMRGAPDTFALGGSLSEEVAACLLGGHGIPADIGLAAFHAVRDSGALESSAGAGALEAILSAPLRVPGRQKPVRYRFARQRAQRLSASLRLLGEATAPEDPLELRAWLLGLPGVGPKTASWIVRNRTACDDVAIIDIHVHRAGLNAGFFCPSWRLPTHYLVFEAAFCRVAAIAGVSAAALDACIWDQMQRLGRAQHLLLG
jgi:N-glycosylase/DNA lyase